jgi:hypothetical protein
MDEPGPGTGCGAIEGFVDSGATAERGTAAGVLRGSRPAGPRPEDATARWLEPVSCCCCREERSVTRRGLSLKKGRKNNCRSVETCRRHVLVAEARRHGDTVPSLGATARQHSSAGLGLHARAEAMHLGAVAAVGLEGTLGHRTVLIRESLPYGQVLSIADSVQIRQSTPFRGVVTPPQHCAHRACRHSLNPRGNAPHEHLRAANLQFHPSHLFACIAFLSSSHDKTCASPRLPGTSSQAVVQHDFLVTKASTRCFRLC